RLLLPFHPLRGGPTAGAGHLLAMGPGGRNQYELLRLPIGRGRQQDALNQTEHRRGCANAQRQREHGDQGEAGLLEQHSHAKTQVLKHSSSLVLVRFATTRRLTVSPFRLNALIPWLLTNANEGR